MLGPIFPFVGCPIFPLWTALFFAPDVSAHLFRPMFRPIKDLIGFLKETYQILKETYPILKETYQILNGALIGPYRALVPSAASPRELILTKIVLSVKYPINLRTETDKMVSVA